MQPKQRFPTPYWYVLHTLRSLRAHSPQIYRLWVVWHRKRLIVVLPICTYLGSICNIEISVCIYCQLTLAHDPSLPFRIRLRSAHATSSSK